MTQDSDILERITALVTEERALREQPEHRLTPEELERVRAVERSLDQCWDLLRQRRARDEYGQDPDDAEVRSTSQVEGYRQ
ncbi:DUF2630 family protein [Nocardiopsis sediminis]|uniref:DUF2630 family protein n=1 Tax=Nocardiopsis sediminis TaxID=1778267 RepID=A0ABV8FU87_9ACTN